MQYGVELFPYKRVKDSKDELKKRRFKSLPLVVKFISYFIAAFLTSRVIMINLMAPFGIAFLIAVITCEEDKVILVSGIGTVLGYVSLYNNIKSLPVYIITTATLIAISYILRRIDQRKKLILMFFTLFVEFAFYKLLILKITAGMSFMISFFEVSAIFPLYFIINYSIICFKQYKTRHLYSSEEIISMSVTVSLVVAGTWGTSIREISIRNVIALAFILIVGYTKGSSAGAASGVAMGTIIGVTSSNMIAFVGVYGVCGLISGIFRETGKWMSGLAYLVAFAVLKMYSDIGVQFKLIEVIISSIFFFMIPGKIFKKIELELDWQKKQEYFKENYAEKIKALLVNKLENFSEVLFGMSEILEKLVYNDKLLMKNKSTALIENLADRVCSTCSMQSMCWKRENFYTYNAFSELIQSYQDNKKQIPYEIERKCIKRSAVIKNTEEIVNNYIINEMWKNRLSECRELLSGQIESVGDSVSEIVHEFNYNIKFNTETENTIRRVLNKNNIHYRDIFCYTNKNNRLLAKLSMNACGGKQICIKNILPLINEVTGKCMCVSDDGCNLNTELKVCSVTFEETPKYHVAAYSSKCCKDGEKYSGDSCSFQKLSDGTYLTVISDGMGFGPQAGKESNAAVELIERFSKAGFNKITAINAINSIMTMKFSEEEKFSTLDLNSIDLYKGEVDFMKVGAVASFIKRGEDVDVVKSKTLPIGVLDKPDIDITRKKVENGDVIIMLSDGVLDYESQEAGKYEWILDFLKENKANDPKQLCEEIINNAKKLSKGKIKDDMTVIVEKVYSLY
ncbi:stage II sporulation protein E [Clostridium sp. P21]|uniref:Stage II sporulation protein E n=1 Tax=Clostridium muellerianum TaxID=2716538 RepID=A0A7Y0EGS2_9CLOT|nr:stage II sporulation protein E [Clostridium muellerianum]NMM62170.1 stage II sporulation protein E [Clostridium muellerianum]